MKYRAADHISVREWLAFVVILSIAPLIVAAVVAIVIRVLKGFPPVASAAPYPRVWAGIPTDEQCCRFSSKSEQGSRASLRVV